MSSRGNPRSMHGDTNWRSQGRGRGRGHRGAIAAPSFRGSDTATHRPSASNDPSKRRFDLIASVSRSSGLEKDGDDLKNHRLQEEYRIFIQDKAKEVCEMQARSSDLETDDARMQRIGKQENLLILFRKLREGVSSSSRKDAFALEVYQTSLYYSVIFESPKQTASIIFVLFPSRISEGPQSSNAVLPSPSICSILISLLHYIVVFYPSQSAYHQHLSSISDTLLPRKSGLMTWLQSVTKSMRTRNYAKISSLTQRVSVLKALQTFGDHAKPMESHSKSVSPHSNDDLGLEAVLWLVDTLRKKVAETSWSVIRSAYREFACDQTSVETRDWLKRTLNIEESFTGNQRPAIEAWLEDKASVGHLRRKEGIEGRWIVCKAH